MMSKLSLIRFLTSALRAFVSISQKGEVSNICLVRKNNTVIKNNKMLKIMLYWALCLVEGIKPLFSLW